MNKNSIEGYPNHRHLRVGELVKQNLGQKYWTKAKKFIPGGTSLFTKNPDLHLPQKWPAYYSKAKNMTIWDLENNKYSDCFLMGVGTNSLGYANKFIDITTFLKGINIP